MIIPPVQKLTVTQLFPCVFVGRDVVPGTGVRGYLCLVGGCAVAGGVDTGQGALLELHAGQPTSPQPHIERAIDKRGCWRRDEGGG